MIENVKIDEIEKVIDNKNERNTNIFRHYHKLIIIFLLNYINILALFICVWYNLFVLEEHGLLAQLVEQLTLNQWVQGSNP